MRFNTDIEVIDQDCGDYLHADVPPTMLKRLTICHRPCKAIANLQLLRPSHLKTIQLK
jgi:hypothetical protein